MYPSGKSTLLNLIAGILQPSVGTVTRNPKARIAVFSQHHVDSLELAFSPIQYFVRSFPSVDPQVGFEMSRL
jgi:ATPase subunit of ABC transporter with duplicated ATPase domains